MPKRKTTVLTTKTSTEAYDGNLGKGTFSTTIKVKEHPAYDCCKQVEADFYLQLEGKKRKVKVGEIIAYVVDKTAVNPEDNSKKPKALWLGELLADDEDASEVSTLMRCLYTKKGSVRAGFRAQQAELDVDKICHLDCLKLGEPYRGGGKGIGKMALEAFHAMLPQLDDGCAFSGTVVLSPATPDTVKTYKKTSLYEQEGELIVFYEKRGYVLWVRGSEHVEGSVSVMGCTI